MIITKHVRVSRVLNITWKTDLAVLVSCIATYLLDQAYVSQWFKIPTLIPSVIGTALAFFIGFSNNQAYARWWEGREIWGSIVNNSRSWARGIISYSNSGKVAPSEVIRIHDLLVRRQIAFVYALKAALRNQGHDEYRQFLDEQGQQQVANAKNKHNAILTLQAQELERIYADGWVDSFKFIHLNDLIVRLTDDMGRCERIKNTIFPTTYHSFTRLFIWVFGITITMAASETTGKWSIFLGFLVSFIFHTTHTIGMSLLNPFEPEVTGIPLDQISRTIEINLLEMLGEQDLPEPVKPVNNEYVM